MRIWLTIAAMIMVVSACAPPPENEGLAPQYIDVDKQGPVSGAGIEGQDVVAMTDLMARDILALPQISNVNDPPRIIVDSRFFSNEGTQRININVLTDRIRSNLIRNAKGKIRFVSRENVTAVEEEKQTKSAETTDTGVKPDQQLLGADYRITGRISDITTKDSKGQVKKYNQILFELIDLTNSEIVWSNTYEFQKAAGDDVIYR